MFIGCGSSILPKETQNQLEELSKAGVVDAGAKGFFILFEGMTNFIVNNKTNNVVNFILLIAKISPVLYANTIAIQTANASNILSKKCLQTCFLFVFPTY